jgi:hypothetical protein
LNYVKAREEARREDKAYQLYVADSLFYQRENARLTERLADILNRNRTKPAEKPAEEITADVMKRHGLRFKQKEGGGDK